MVARIGLTQKIMNDPYGQRHDALDQNWTLFLEESGINWIPIPNRLHNLPLFLRSWNLDGIILSGGNDLSRYGGDVPERDAIERELLDYTIGNNLPLIGVCRGFQMIVDYFGGSLQPVQNHAKVIHRIDLEGKVRMINSYHHFGCLKIPDCLMILANADDGVIEAIRHKQHPIYGIMWHPERMNPFEAADLDFFRIVLRGRL